MAFFSLKLVVTVFVSSVISSNVIAESSVILAKYFASICSRIANNLLCTHDVFLDFYTRTNIFRYSAFGLNYIFYHQTYINIHIIHYFVNLFDSFILVIMLNCFVWNNTLLDKLLRALQLLTHLSKLTANE